MMWHCTCAAHDRLSLTVGEERRIFKPKAPKSGNLWGQILKKCLGGETIVFVQKESSEKEIVISRLVVGVTKMMVSDVENNA